MATRVRYCLILALAFGWLGAGSPPVTAARMSAPFASSPSARAAQKTLPPEVILLIGIDTLRADHLPAYGYFRDTTPELDDHLVDDGVVFSDATSSTGWTFPANGAVHTGIAPFRLGLRWYPYADPVPDEATTLAEYLQQGGYHTAGFVSNPYASHYVGLHQGFDHYDDSLIHYPMANSACAEQLTDQVISWTASLTETAPLFLFTYYVDPHTWYNPPPPYDIRYDPTYTGTLTPAGFGDGDPGAITSPRDLEHLLALYDGEISYTDEHIGRLLDDLDGQGLLDDALIVLYVDHGEEFDEHGVWTHGNTDYEELLRVPLMVRYSGVITGARTITSPVQTMDVTPTILDYAGIPIPPGLDGASLRPLLAGDVPPEVRPIYSEINTTGALDERGQPEVPAVNLRGLRLGEWKYIHHIWNEADDELYRLSPVSVYESVNLIQAEPTRAQAMLLQLKSWYLLNGTFYAPLILYAPPW